jgi:hypothetical protein
MRDRAAHELVTRDRGIVEDRRKMLAGHRDPARQPVRTQLGRARPRAAREVRTVEAPEITCGDGVARQRPGWHGLDDVLEPQRHLSIRVVDGVHARRADALRKRVEET